MTTKDDENTLLRSVALQNASSILVARQRAEQRREAYLAEAQRLSHTGSFGWRISTNEILWSEETYRIFHYDQTTTPTVNLMLQRVHPEDAALVKQTIERAGQDGKDFDSEHRLLMPDGSVTYVHVVAHAFSDGSGSIEFIGAVMDVTEQQRAEMSLAGEKRLLEMMARGDSRALILEALCRLVEELASGSLSSILLLDPKANRLRHGAAPSLPVTYTEAIDGAIIGPSVGSCGTAAYRAEPVIVSDIATDPLWADYRDLALAHGLRACWSIPILSSQGRVLGTFATYYREPRSPTPQDQNIIERITDLASIAVERQQAEEVLREQASLLNLTRDSIFVRGMDDVITYWNRGAEELYGWTAEQAVGKVSHQLTQTVFPAPIDEIRAELLRTGRWESELVHTKADGTQVVVASRWALQSDPQGNPLAVLETNNDITGSKQAAQALEDLAGRLIHAQEEERSRIGRELHDHISQTLGLLTIKIDQLRANGEITPGIGGALDELHRDTSKITDDVHRLSHRLHSSTLDYLGLVPALQKLVSEFSERHDIAITFAHASLPPSLPSEVALCLFRIAEESLTNIAKHSQARSANIQVAGAPDGIHLTVEDAGAGFDMTTLGSKGGLGFVSMQERLRALHGTIHVDSAPSRGTRIDAWVPPIILTSAHHDAAHRSETA